MDITHVDYCDRSSAKDPVPLGLTKSSLRKFSIGKLGTRKNMARWLVVAKDVYESRMAEEPEFLPLVTLLIETPQWFSAYQSSLDEPVSFSLS